MTRTERILAMVGISLITLLGGYGLYRVAGSDEVRGAIVGAVVTVIVSIIGWYIGFSTALRAQRQLLLDQLRTAAIEQISGELVRVQESIGRAFRDVHTVSVNAERAERNEEVNVHLEQNRLDGVIEDLSEPQLWEGFLAQNVQLFPDTDAVRKQLHERVGALRDELVTLRTAVRVTPGKELNRRQMGGQMYAAATNALVRITGHMELQNLFQDLRVHLHNSALADLTGKQVADRDDSTATRERIVLGDDGFLTIARSNIVVPGDTTPGSPAWERKRGRG